MVGTYEKIKTEEAESIPPLIRLKRKLRAQYIFSVLSGHRINKLASPEHVFWICRHEKWTSSLSFEHILHPGPTYRPPSILSYDVPKAGLSWALGCRQVSWGYNEVLLKLEQLIYFLCFFERRTMELVNCHLIVIYTISQILIKSSPARPPNVTCHRPSSTLWTD